MVARWRRLSLQSRFSPDLTDSSLHLDNVVEVFNNERPTMSTVNFSVPEDIKNAFNTVFEGQNKSAVIAELMREAVERAQSQQRSKEAYQRILLRR